MINFDDTCIYDQFPIIACNLMSDIKKKGGGYRLQGGVIFLFPKHHATLWKNFPPSDISL